MRLALCVALTLAAAAILAPGSAGAATISALPARALQTAPPAIDLIARDGFDDKRNVYSWSMARFRGKIYVGTGRLVACVENITIDFFLRVSHRYVTDPLPGAWCPPNPYDMDLRAEIWEYTPSTGRWRLAYRSPADVPNPRAPGKFVARDIAFRGMTVFRDGQGRRRLYIGGVTADEYIPELKLGHPPRILSTLDGRHFRATPARRLVVKVPYGVFRPIGFRTMRVWHKRMFVTATPGLTGDGAIFEVTRPWNPRRVRFRQVTPRSLAVFETEIFKDHLYAGTGDRTNGYGVYKMRRSGSSYRFTPIVTHGAGRGEIATSVVSMHVFKRRLYVGSSGWYNEEQLPVSEMIRIDGRGGWQIVTGPPRTIHGVLKVPLSGLGDGFNNIFTAHFWRMTTYRGAIVVGTNDWSYLVQTAYPGLDQWVVDGLSTLLQGELGFDLWASCDGRDWAPITRNAFGGNQYDFGARNLVTAPSGLYIGSANHAQGTKVWHYAGPNCLHSPTKPAATPAAAAVRGAAPAAPRRLMTDVQRGGTVLSWRRPATATPDTRFRVLRASYDDVRLSLTAPPVLSDGFRPEDQLPVVTAPGAPGSTAAELPVMRAFTTIGRTRASYFVDRTAQRGAHYAYRVAAENASGPASAGSNVQVVPDPRPPATAEQVSRQLGSVPAPAARATMASVARSPAKRAAALRALARLRRGTPRASDVRDLVERLARRVRYAGIADGGRGG